MRYVVALIVACTIFGAGALYVLFAFWSVETTIRETLRRQKEAGTLPPDLQDVDPDAPKLPDIAIQLPRGEQTKLQLAMLLEDWWFVLAPLTITVCLGIAKLTERFRRAPI